MDAAVPVSLIPLLFALTEEPPAPAPPAPAPPAVEHTVSLRFLEAAYPAAGVELAASPPAPAGEPWRNPIATWGSSLQLQRDIGRVPLVVAANGGGYRAAFYTEGVLIGLDAMLLTQGQERSLFDEVDAWSTVSGASMLLLNLLSQKVDPLHLREDQLAAQREDMDTKALLAGKPKRQIRVMDDAYGGGARSSLSVYQNDKGALWVPNASRVIDGLRLPLTCDRMDCKGEGSAALAVFASGAVPGALWPVLNEHDPNSKSGKGWMMDGAWGDRLGLLTALELAMGLGKAAGVAATTVLSVDSRPWPQLLNQQWTEADIEGPIKKLKSRAQLIGFSMELSRTQADRRIAELAFGPMRTTPLAAQQRAALAEEGKGILPDRYAARSVVTEEGYPNARVIRLGADTLLQPELWDADLREDVACQRIAARLYTAVAVQPTDLSLSAPRYVSEADVNAGVARKLYAYEAESKGDAGYVVRDRQAALILAGMLTVFLQKDALAASTGLPAAVPWRLEPPFQKLFTVLDLNFRSWQASNEWNQCLGQRMIERGRYAGSDSNTLRMGFKGKVAPDRLPPEHDDPALRPWIQFASRGRGDIKVEHPCDNPSDVSDAAIVACFAKVAPSAADAAAP